MVGGKKGGTAHSSSLQKKKTRKVPGSFLHQITGKGKTLPERPIEAETKLGLRLKGGEKETAPNRWRSRRAMESNQARSLTKKVRKRITQGCRSQGKKKNGEGKRGNAMMSASEGGA